MMWCYFLRLCVKCLNVSSTSTSCVISTHGHTFMFMWIHIWLDRKVAPQSTAGDDGSVADISYMSIFSHVQGLLPRRQLAATRWSAQIPVRAHCFGCISQIKFCWKLPHFRSPDIFYFISKLKIVGPLLNNISTQFSEGWKVLTKYKSQGVNVLMFHLIKW